MEIGSHHLDIEDLPRARFGGLQPEPVIELVRSLYWEYSQLAFEYKKLEEELEGRSAAPLGGEDSPEAEPTLHSAETREVETAEPTAAPIQSPVAIEPVPTALEPVPRPEPQRVHEAGRTSAEVVRHTLEVARRTSREMRESARQDCEAMLKKARDRTVKLEHDFERAKAERESELEQLDARVREIREQMRQALETFLPPEPVAESTPLALASGNGATSPAPEAGSDPERVVHIESKNGWSWTTDNPQPADAPAANL